MTCEHCAETGVRAPVEPFCPHCEALQPLPKGADPFAVLGLQETFAVDAADLNARHRKLSRRLHPDRFVRANAGDKLRALEWTTAINDALRALRLPEDRAALMLKKRGVDFAETGSELSFGQLPLDFLEAVLEEREALAEAIAADDHGAAEALATRIRERLASERTALFGLFARIEAAEAGGGEDQAALQEAAETLARLRYAARFLEEAEAFEREGLE